MGTRQTLKMMRREVLRDRFLPRLRLLVLDLVRPLPPKAFGAEINAVFQFVRTRIRYTLDHNGRELLQSPHVTLNLGTGDCDDMCILLACLLESLGHACYFCAVGFEQPGFFSHVYVLCDPAGDARKLSSCIALDATENYPMGWEPGGITCKMVCAIDADMNVQA